MKRYTVGFIFDNDLSHVLLIKKTKPAEQAGLFNGIGGKFEDYDIDAAHCVSREVNEEAGLNISAENWAELGAYSDNEYFYVAILTTQVEYSVLLQARSLTEEEVVIIKLDEIDNIPFANMAKEMLIHCKKSYI